MINPFKADAAKRLDRDLDNASAAHMKLTARHAAAEAAVIERRAEAQALARDGADDAALDTAEAAHRGAQDRVITLAAALAETTQQVAALERSVADLADRKLRAETGAAIDKMADEMEKAGKAFDLGAEELATISQRVADIVLDGHGLQAFSMKVRAEVPAAVEMIAGLLRERARATLAGTAAAALPKPETPPAPQAPPPKTERVFLRQDVKWTDASGQLRLAPQFSDAELPPAAAGRALKSGAALSLDNPRRKKLYGIKPPRQPDPSRCQSLDAEPIVAAPVRHSAFEPMDRGPVYTIKVPREVTS